MSQSVRELLQTNGLEEKLIQEIEEAGIHREVSEGETIITPGSKSLYMPIVLEGLLRVVRQDEDGNELLLYYLEGGETCAMSLACCIEDKNNDFMVTAEKDTVLWMVPMNYLDGWIQKFKSFRKFVFLSYQTRFDELLHTIDSITFLKLQDRLYKFLLDKKQATRSYDIHMSHQEIARQLNTSRVVISRLLKQLEKEEKIDQHRNRIEIL